MSSVLPLHGRFVAPGWVDPYLRRPCASLAALKLAQKTPPSIAGRSSLGEHRLRGERRRGGAVPFEESRSDGEEPALASLVR